MMATTIPRPGNIISVASCTMTDLRCVSNCILRYSTCILTGCLPVLLTLQLSSPLCSGTELGALVAGPTPCGAYLSEFCEMDLKSFGVLVKPKSDHGVEDILSAYGFAFLDEAFLCGFACDEAYELRDTFLNAFLRLL